MNSANLSPSRERLFRHIVSWELRRLALPLAIWLIASLSAIFLIFAADWSWPDSRDKELWQARREKQLPVEAGMALAAAAAVYLTGELFLGLRPGVVRARWAFPPCRQDALKAAFLIQTALVMVPFVIYYRGWVTAQGWEKFEFVRQFLPLVPAFAAGLALVAMLTGDWGMYLLVSAGVTLGLWWFDPAAFQHPGWAAGVLTGIVSLAAAFAALRWRRPWAVLAVWVPCVVVLMKM